MTLVTAQRHLVLDLCCTNEELENIIQTYAGVPLVHCDRDFNCINSTIFKQLKKTIENEKKHVFS